MSVAIIGLGCLFPGSENLAAYWRAIKNGTDAIGDIPADHWSVDDYYDPDPKAEDKTYGRRGGFLSTIAFEPMKYGIVPNDISAIDATQLLGLMAADQALNDAGYGSDSGFDHRRTSVLLGVTGALKMVVSLGSRLAHPQLRRALSDSGVDDETTAEVLKRFASEFTPWQENSFPGLLGNVTAGRIANRLNLGGSNMVVDAACASSLAAIRQGLMELSSGQADLVVTGGLDTFSDPFMYTCFSKTPALSPSGDVRPYDQNGDGTVLGEGIGMLILKRLKDAKRDGDRIYAVIRSVGSSSDGKGTAIFAPSAEGQCRALANAYRNAGIDPGSIGLVEGHGTGTAVGDAVEVEALNRVFKESPRAEEARPWCALGSVKAQIGHTKAAAGAAGLIKAAMALYMKTLPPAVKVDQPLPILTEAGSPFHLSTRPRPWISSGPRRAAVSAFGFGGSNFHCLLEEDEPSAAGPALPESLLFLAFSAETKEELALKLKKAQGAEKPQAAAEESRRTFSAAQPFRLALVTYEKDFPLLAEKNLSVMAGIEVNEQALPDGVFYGSGQPCPDQFGYLLPGPESVCRDMFRELAEGWPEVLEALSDSAGRLAQEAPDLSSLDLILYPPDLASSEMIRKWEEEFDDSRFRLAAAQGFGRGLIRLLEKFGLRPAAVAGGEDGPVNLVQELNRKHNQSIGLWLEVGCGCEMSLSVLSAFGKRHQVLALDGGGGGHEDLARFLARLAAWGLPLDLSAWPGSQPFTERRAHEDAGAFTVNISGANYFVKKKIPPSRPKPAAGPAKDRPLEEVLERMTSETARIHQDFLAQQAEALRLIGLSLETAAAAQTGRSLSMGAEPEQLKAMLHPESDQMRPHLPAAPKPVAAIKRPGADTVMDVVSRETGYPVEMLNPDMDLEADLGLDSIKKVEIMAVLSEIYPDVQGFGAETMNQAATLGDLMNLVGPVSGPSIDFDALSEPAISEPARPAGKTGADLWLVLREVVSAETGYPLEMLNPEMRLGDDLGLDSIKMVEIASVMSERLPQASILSADVLASAQTLADLAAAVEGSAKPETGASDGRETARSQAAPAIYEPFRPPADSAASQGSEQVILEVVSQETGYPRDMLKMGMHLEGDLGLDSIKKVEIMAALSERLPEVEALADGETLAGLQTLADLAALTGGANSEVQQTQTWTSNFSRTGQTSSPAARASSASLDSLLLEVVSSETGYPKEMLSLNASLEADLGLDSIKRVEIMAALSEKLGDDNLTGSSAELLGGAVTLGDLRDLVLKSSGSDFSAVSAAEAVEPEARKRGPGRPPKNSPPAFKTDFKIEAQSPEAATSTTGVSSFKVEMVDLDLSSAAAFQFAPGGRVCLVSDETPLAEALGSLLAERVEVERLKWSESEQAGDWPDLNGLIMIWPGDSGDLELSKAAFKALRSAGPALIKAAENGRDSLLLAFSFMGGAFGEGEEAPSAPVSASLAGLVKTAAREWPKVRAKVLDLPISAFYENGSVYPGAAMLAAGLDEPAEIGLTAEGGYQTPRLKSYKLKNIRVRHIREGQTLLVTGGARGVTAAALKEVARAFKPHLVIMGRTPLPPEEPQWLRDLKDEASIRQALFERAKVKPGPRELARESTLIAAGREIKTNLAAMEKAGAKVTYISGDFQDESALVSAVGEVKRLYGPIYGFIHGAGVLADSLILDKKDEDFAAVFDTKAKMADLILSELKGQPLNLVAFFSSSTARFGRKGQADYAAGNEVLNKLAASLAAGRQGPKCLSINWGPWAGGMVDAGLARLFEDEGIGLIPLPEGARLFSALAGAPKNDPVEVVVLGPSTDLSALV